MVFRFPRFKQIGQISHLVLFPFHCVNCKLIKHAIHLPTLCLWFSLKPCNKNRNIHIKTFLIERNKRHPCQAMRSVVAIIVECNATVQVDSYVWGHPPKLCCFHWSGGISMTENGYLLSHLLAGTSISTGLSGRP